MHRITERTVEVAIENRAVGHLYRSLLKMLLSVEDIEDTISNSRLILPSLQKLTPGHTFYEPLGAAWLCSFLCVVHCSVRTLEHDRCYA
jgi:hypothetical protein